MSLARFNQVEQALVSLINTIPTLQNKVYVGLYTSPLTFPRAEVYAERVFTSETSIAGRKLMHFWQFSVVLSHVVGNAKEGYEKMKELFWAVYDKIMADRTLGLGGDVFATPSTDSRLETGPTEDNKYGFRWWMQVTVRVAEL
jgi:hypothetical protein